MPKPCNLVHLWEDLVRFMNENNQEANETLQNATIVVCDLAATEFVFEATKAFNGGDSVQVENLYRELLFTFPWKREEAEAIEGMMDELNQPQSWN